MGNGVSKSDSYAAAGVDITAGYRAVELMKKHYDYIILDFPPVNIVSDAAIMSEIVDGYLIVVRHNESEYHKISETLRQMQFAGAKILGFVYNGKDDRKKYYKSTKYNKYYYHNKYYYK